MDIKGLSPNVIAQINKYPVNTQIHEKNNFFCLFSRMYTGQKIPKQFDARKKWKNLIIEPIKQFCGSCWAFASITMLNDRLNIFTKRRQINLSIKHTFECNFLSTWKENNLKQLIDQPIKYQCQGDYLISGLYYLYFFGTTWHYCNLSDPRSIIESLYFPFVTSFQSDLCYSNYDVNQSYCGFSVVNNGNYYGEAYYKVQGLFPYDYKNIMAIQEDIMNFGPIATTFRCFSDFWTFDAKNTVYKKSDDAKFISGHAVVIVGWGEDYWICRNSWGDDWGDHGYFKFTKGSDECGIESNCLACLYNDFNNDNIELYYTDLFKKNDDISYDYFKLGIDINNKSDNEYANTWKDLNQSIFVCSLLHCKNGQDIMLGNYSLEALDRIPGVQNIKLQNSKKTSYVYPLFLKIFIGICIIIILLLIRRIYKK